MEIKTEKIAQFFTIQQRDKRGHIIKTVFFKYVPVVHYNIDDSNETKLAAIELVERNWGEGGKRGKKRSKAKAEKTCGNKSFQGN